MNEKLNIDKRKNAEEVFVISVKCYKQLLFLSYIITYGA